MLTITTPPDLSAVHILMIGAMPMVVPWKCTPLEKKKKNRIEIKGDVTSFNVTVITQVSIITYEARYLVLLVMLQRKRFIIHTEPPEMERHLILYKLPLAWRCHCIHLNICQSRYEGSEAEAWSQRSAGSCHTTLPTQC